MVAKEQENNDRLQDFDYEAEDTLSLSDLVESSRWNNNDLSNSKEEYQSGFDDQDFFEFFSQDFTASSASSYSKDHIIFCGKLIPYKQPAAVNLEQAQKQNNIKSSYRYNALSPRKGYQQYSYEHDLSVKEVSTLATSVKPRWYLLAFGHGRFPSERKLRDIKNRQRRRIPARMFPLDVGSEMVKSSEKRLPWKGFWALLEVMGCKSQRAYAVDCIRHV